MQLEQRTQSSDMQYVRFADRLPPSDAPGELICCYADRRPFVYHWRTDVDGHTEQRDFFWLEGFKLPPAPTLADVRCCCDRKRAA
jgi:hypothetical protein